MREVRSARRVGALAFYSSATTSVRHISILYTYTYLLPALLKHWHMHSGSALEDYARRSSRELHNCALCAHMVIAVSGV